MGAVEMAPGSQSAHKSHARTHFRANTHCSSAGGICGEGLSKSRPEGCLRA